MRIRNLNADPDPDPATQINADPCGSGYRSGSETLAGCNNKSKHLPPFRGVFIVCLTRLSIRHVKVLSK
jgi:hypothetical protein